MIYDGLTMNHEKDIACPGVILAIEFIPCKNSICVSLSDRTFLFYDASSSAYKQIKKFVLPSTQKCLCYVQRKRLLFSVGTDGAVFAWLIDKIFQNDYFDESKNEGGDKEDYKYRHFTTENTPWFLGGFGSCIVDLPNLEQIATGAYTMKIELWELRTDSQTEFVSQYDYEDKTSAKNSLAPKTNASQASRAKSKKSGTSSIFAKSKKGGVQEEQLNQRAKEPKRILVGHKKGIREIAYSESYKILVSVGFDFQVFVWNPYCTKEIMTLQGHEFPLVGVNVPFGLECFITCDNKGVINVWDINDYSCLQCFSVSNVN